MRTVLDHAPVGGFCLEVLDRKISANSCVTSEDQMVLLLPSCCLEVSFDCFSLKGQNGKPFSKSHYVLP